ncbi:helix-turn-helix domain-containing protein [Bifidobacterium sp.]|uniref:helix-turn-helix domain-containing protein n=1 Tax=Bifidobacterium sp. TaxID=41200 RepID=UPI0038688338
MHEQNYRKAREQAGIKAERAAAELGVSITTLFNWERGDTNPDADKVKAMARLYRVSPDYLLAME